MDRRLLGSFPSRQVRGDVLQHHYGVVHHHAYGNRKGGHRNDVQGVAGGVQVHQRRQQGHRNRQYDDEGRFEVAQEEEHHQHDHQEGDYDGVPQRLDSIDDLRGAVDQNGHVHVCRQRGLDLLQLLLDALDYVYRIGARLLLDDDSGGTDAVGVRLLLPLLAAVAHGGHVTQVHRTSAGGAYNDVQQLRRVAELLLHAEGVGTGADVYVAGGQVLVLRCDDRSYAADAQFVSFQPSGVAIDLDLTGGGTGDAHRTHSRHARQRGGKAVVQYLVQTVEAGVSRRGKEHDGHVVCAELEDDGHGRAVRQVGVDHVQLVADVVGRLFYVCAVLEGQGKQGYVLLGPGSQFLKVLHAVEGILEHLGKVVLDVCGVGPGIRCHHHDGIGIELGELGDARPAQREDAEYHEGDKYESGGNRVLDRCSVDAHYCPISTV